MTGRIGVDKGRGIYVHKPDRKRIDELSRRKVDRRLVREMNRKGRRSAGMASKDQI